MNIKFPELRGGPVQGLNDAGVENFQGAIDVYVSRECGQNTGDAPGTNVETVRLMFERLTMRSSEIPAFHQLRETLDACLDRWRDKDKEREFFEQAVSLAAKDEISVLRISDFGTTGLTGDDMDEKGRWVALVKSQGLSNKGNTAGGSFGIGKSSPFAASRFRTVFYGTRTEAGNVALQGVSRLVTHKNRDGKLTQGTGFIGDYDPDGGEGGEPVFRAVRDQSKIPAQFRRTEPGTDIWIIGYRSGPEWSNDLIRSILMNFWPAIYRGSIEFSVGDKLISKANLAELINAHIGQEDFDAHHFHKAIASQPIKKTLNHVGACELYLTASAPDLPRRICMVRNTGMKIYDYQPKACRVPFSGLFICTDQDGNKLLRKLEPPKHDIWDPKRIEDGTGKKALDEIKLWIREEVKKLNPLFAGSSFNESELAKYIPDLTPDDPSDLPEDGAGNSEEESLEPKSADKRQHVKPVQAKPVEVRPGDGSDGGGGPERDDTGGGGGEAGDWIDGRGETGPSAGGAVNDSNPPVLQVRSFRTGEDGTYELVLRSDKDYTGPVCVQAVGEDGQRERVSLLSAQGPEAASKSFDVRGDAIQEVNLAAGLPFRIKVKLEAIDRLSLTAMVRK